MPTRVLPAADVVPVVLPVVLPTIAPQADLHPGITAAVAVVGTIATGLYFWLGRR